MGSERPSGRVEQLLEELVRWTKASAYAQVRETLLRALDSPNKLRVYALTDGKRTTRQIGRESGVNIRYVSEYWQAWEAIGILERVPGTRARRRAVFSLEDFGIEVPGLPSEASLEGGRE